MSTETKGYTLQYKTMPVLTHATDVIDIDGIGESESGTVGIGASSSISKTANRYSAVLS